MQWWQLRAAANAVNGTTLLGVGLAVAGRARLERGPRGLLLATGYAFGLPAAGAFTVGNVVLTRHDPSWWATRESVLRHEERHATQYAVTLGLPFLPLYAVAAGWSWLRGGDAWAYNVFETTAGLADGGYDVLSRRQRRRLARTA